ncbi:hypothetical protein MMC24_004226 [Lignoscripta atroalba]|nr:hypothetical protein [Lignoscripta atroalba]
MAPLQVGVMMEAVQLSDITCIDILGNLSTEYLKASATFGGDSGVDLVGLGTDVVFHYISTTLDPAFMTPSMRVLPTVTYDDAPRDLDILIIGGPLPTHRPAAADKFMKEAAEHTKTVMTTCVGGMWLASAGVLDGKRATTNRGAVEMARKMYPKVDWVDGERWVVDGKFWTAGGAGAGIDMVGTFARERFDERVVAFALEGLDFDPSVRGRFYK